MQVEFELNEIFRLVVAGASKQEIMQLRKLPDRTTNRYMQRLRDRIENMNMETKQGAILFHKEITKERLIKDKRVFQQVMQDERMPGRTRVEAARADAEVNITLFKLENETQVFVDTIRERQSDVLRLDSIAGRERQGSAAVTELSAA